MKQVRMIALLFSIFTLTSAKAQEEAKIETVIKAFAKAGDKNNADELATYLDDNYRIVMNRLFGSESVAIMTKTEYLEKIRTKEYGGDKRTVTIEKIIINGNTASVLVTLAGEKMSSTSLILLVQDGAGNWKLVSDTPVMG